ncbi:MAG: hypothetical protein ACI81O_002217, partial [Cyclobacteriaceae bacterium]
HILVIFNTEQITHLPLKTHAPNISTKSSSNSTVVNAGVRTPEPQP